VLVTAFRAIDGARTLRIPLPRSQDLEDSIGPLSPPIGQQRRVQTFAAAPKNGNGRQYPSVRSEVSIAPTETPLIFQPAISLRSHAPFRPQRIIAVQMERFFHLNTSDTSIQTTWRFRSAVQRLAHLCELSVSRETSVIRPSPHHPPISH